MKWLRVMTWAIVSMEPSPRIARKPAEFMISSLEGSSADPPRELTNDVELKVVP